METKDLVKGLEYVIDKVLNIKSIYSGYICFSTKEVILVIFNLDNIQERSMEKGTKGTKGTKGKNILVIALIPLPLEVLVEYIRCFIAKAKK